MQEALLDYFEYGDSEFDVNYYIFLEDRLDGLKNHIQNLLDQQY